MKLKIYISAFFPPQKMRILISLVFVYYKTSVPLHDYHILQSNQCLNKAPKFTFNLTDIHSSTLKPYV